MYIVAGARVGDNCDVCGRPRGDKRNIIGIFTNPQKIIEILEEIKKLSVTQYSSRQIEVFKVPSDPTINLQLISKAFGTTRCSDIESIITAYRRYLSKEWCLSGPGDEELQKLGYKETSTKPSSLLKH